MVNAEFMRKVNAKAIENLDLWIPVLFPAACQIEDGYRIPAVSMYRIPAFSMEDVVISPNSKGQWKMQNVLFETRGSGRERCTTPLALVLEFGCAQTTQEAAFWLCSELGIDPAELA